MRYFFGFLLLSFLLSINSLFAQQEVVSAEDGGPGFEKIAAKLGWQTGELSDEELRLVADPKAKKGGSLRIAITDFPATFRAYGKDENSQVTRMIHGLVYEPLITVNPITLELLPVLASHWKVEEDGQTYWFRIDPRARFADGTSVTTEDVLATYDLALDRRILSPATNIVYDRFDPPEAISPYIFKIHVQDKSWKNLLYFGGTEILPAHIIDDITGTEYLSDWNYHMPPGSGPYEVDEENVEYGKRITLTRRKDWWGGGDSLNIGQYNFDSLILLTVADERLELNTFKNGEVDLYIIRRAQWYQEEFNFDEVERGLVQVRRIFTDEPQGVSGLVFNMRKPPLDDIRVREALTYLFDREGIVGSQFYDVDPMINSYYPGSVYENPNNPKVQYNPEKAAELLAEAGYTKRNREGILVNSNTGIPFVLEMPVAGVPRGTLLVIQQDFKKAGVKLEFNTVDGVTQFKMLNERNFDIAYMNWGATLYPNPKSEYHSNLADIKNTNNIGGFKNERADELMDKEAITFDQAERVKILRELDSILVASKMYAFGWYAPFQRVAYWNKFGQPEFYVGKISDWRYILCGWWYDPDKAKKVEEGRTNTSVKMPVGSRDVRFWEKYNRDHR